MRRAKRMDEVKTSADWADEFSIPRSALSTLGFRDDTKVPGWAVMDLMLGIQKGMSMEPRLGSMFKANEIDAQVRPLVEQYKVAPTEELYATIQAKEKDIQRVMRQGDQAAALKAKEMEKIWSTTYEKLSKEAKDTLSLPSEQGVTPNDVMIPDPNKKGGYLIVPRDKWIQQQRDDYRKQFMGSLMELSSIIERLQGPPTKGVPSVSSPQTDIEKLFGGVGNYSLDRTPPVPPNPYAEAYGRGVTSTVEGLRDLIAGKAKPFKGRFTIEPMR
jgi:hypothetical protein